MPEPTVFNGRYQLHRRIGKGGMAEVFLARDLQLDRPVAVKVLFTQFANDPSFVARFRREAQAAANLNHPNIVSVYDWGQEHGTYFIVMEYVEGRSLADLLRAEGPLPAGRAVDIATDVAAALGAAHSGGVLHRDIKPGNVMVTPSGLAKVADWGIGRAMDSPADENLTQTGSVMGTATYFSPEQAQGHNLDNRSDLYALGVVLYEMITGRTPFQADSAVGMAYKHVQEAPPPPRSVNPSVPPELEAITMQLLEKRADDRYADADDLRADLRRYREGFRVHAMSRDLGQVAVPAGTAVAATVGATQAVSAVEGTAAMPPYIPDEADDRFVEPPRERRSWLFPVALVLLLGVLVGLLYLLASSLGVFDQDDDDVQQVVVPRVIDFPVDQARQVLTEAGLEVSEEAEQVADPARVGLVLSQNPENGIRVDEGTVVVIVVGAQNTFPMPNLAGSTPDQARNTLLGLGFTGELRETPQDSVDVDEGSIISTEPAVGQQVATTATINLVVSSGPPQTPLPDCAGLTEADCVTLLTTAQFATQVAQEASATVDEGDVVRTEPAAGELVDQNATVRIVVSIGPATVEVPSVVGLTQAEATRTLENARFRVAVEVQALAAGDPNDGRVLAQNPPANTNAEQNTTVRIVVGDAADGGATTTESTFLGGE